MSEDKAEPKLRLFAAVEIPGPSRLQLAQLQSELDQKYFRSIKIDNLHLTLVFLGDTPRSRLAELEAILAAAAAPPPPPAAMNARLAGLGAFPTLGKPRTVWAGLEEASGGLARLRKRIAAGLAAAGFGFDAKPYSPHITLAYTRRQLTPSDLISAGRSLHFLAQKHANFAGAPFPVRELVLFKSTLQAGGSLYERLTSLKLD